jgi:hypothetical protein
MLIEAHHDLKSNFVGPRGKFAGAMLCALSIALTLALCAQASASGAAGATLAAVAQSTTPQLSSTASPAVSAAAAALPAPPPAAAAQTAAPQPPRQAAPASNVASLAPSEPRDPGVTTVVREAGERIVAVSDMPRGEGHGAVQAIVHTATAGGALRAVAVPGGVRDLTPARAAEVARAVTHAVAGAAGSTNVVRTLAGTASTLTATVAKNTRLGGAIGHLTGSISGPVLATLQTIGRAALAQPPTAAQQHALAATSPAAVRSRPSSAALALAVASATRASASLASVASNGVERLLAEATPPALRDFARWSAWAPAPGIRGALASGPGEASSTWLFENGPSPASSRARGAHPAPLPAGPAPTPSPGGVSPAAVVGPAAGLSIVLALAALMMLASPPAVRRLRLDGESWRLAPLALIADRPG